jgi:aconitate hydratase
MAPEYGATCGFFPIDEQDDRLSAPDRPRRGADRAGRAYARSRAVARPSAPEPVFTDTLELDMGSVEPSLAGPKRPQDKVCCPRSTSCSTKSSRRVLQEARRARVPVEGREHDIGDGDV